MIWQTPSLDSSDTEKLGSLLGALLSGGEVIELESDLGGGKTTFTRGIAKGMGVYQNITSPTFTISRLYKAHNNLELHHFDFYRLADLGIMSEQLHESVNQDDVVTVIEWGKSATDVLPKKRIKINFETIAGSEQSRQITIIYPEAYSKLIHTLENNWDQSKP